MWTSIKGYLDAVYDYIVKILTLDTRKKEVKLSYKKTGKGYMLITTFDNGLELKESIKDLVDSKEVYKYYK